LGMHFGRPAITHFEVTMFSLSFSLLVGTALAIDYTPVSGSILSDPDGDGYVEVHNGVLAVPQFGGAL